MTYEVVFSLAAKQDLSDTYAYISRTLSAQSAAKLLMTEIEKKITLLSEQPLACPLCHDFEEHGYRKLVVKNYIIVYSVDESNKRVNIIRVFYGRRNYNRYL